MAVNVSAVHFHQPDFHDHVRETLNRHAIDPGRIELELTERSLMEDTEGARNCLRSLKDIGVRLAIDDFGTGYSCLAYLRRFPIDVLKIDRSFVEHARRTSASANLVRSIVQLGQSLHLHIVAEGIEDAEQARLLQGMGVRSGQGYHFARPLAPERFAALLTAWDAPVRVSV
jgi:EAL domain-containing protein (putative c-di-GMP-specific phosphodiesterase class I)